MYPHKLFVKERGDGNYASKNKPVSDHIVTNLKGNEAKTFYEDILKLPSNHMPVAKKAVKVKRIKKPAKKINKSEIFKLAEANNTADLSLLIAEGVDLNVKDAFGWTPLMCAACSGSYDAVELLLNAGADKAACHPGYNALYLAKKHKFTEIINLLNGLEKLNHSISSSASSSKKDRIKYCEICKQNYSTSKRKHEASTPHLIESNSKKAKTFYGIPESNRGFQMLLRNGWDRDHGLGPEGVGRKFPVKPSMKKDRTGIGCVKHKKIQSCTDSPTSKPVNCNHKNKEFERSFRLQFS